MAAASISINPQIDAMLRIPPANPIGPIAPIAAGAPPFPNANAYSSIFVPLKQKVGGYDNDSLITISSIINQWCHYTGDFVAPAGYTEFGMLSGLSQQAAGAVAVRSNPAASFILAMFNNDHQDACEFLEVVITAAGIPAPVAAGLTEIRDDIWNMPSNAAAGGAFAAIGPAAIAAAPVPSRGLCWANVLDSGTNFFSIVNRPPLSQNEGYIPNPGAAGAPIPSVAPGPGGPFLIPPSRLIRYAFGLLYRIKQILGEEGWTGTHWQIASGGKKKSSRFTHRKKQYSQRRYKK